MMMTTKVWSCMALLVFLFHAGAAHEFSNNLRGSQKGDNIQGISELKKHLKHIGYMNFDYRNANITNNNFDDLLESALKNYQSYYNLNVTGTLDDNTLSLLSQLRCGVPDFSAVRPDYSFFPGKPTWWTHDLTYAFAPGTRGDAFSPVAKALGIWASVSPFRFSVNNIYNNANFKISFVGDDGPGKVFAYSFAPRDGRLHFDAAERWVNGAVPGGIDLESVALHEIGHLLGLEHSKDPKAVMYPYISYNSVKIVLQPDDIQGLKALYNF